MAQLRPRNRLGADLKGFKMAVYAKPGFSQRHTPLDLPLDALTFVRQSERRGTTQPLTRSESLPGADKSRLLHQQCQWKGKPGPPARSDPQHLSPVSCNGRTHPAQRAQPAWRGVECSKQQVQAEPVPGEPHGPKLSPCTIRPRARVVFSTLRLPSVELVSIFGSE